MNLLYCLGLLATCAIATWLAMLALYAIFLVFGLGWLKATGQTGPMRK